MYTVNMKTQQMLAPFRKALEQWNMVESGDKIAVGVSGGKDSLTLLKLFKGFQRFSPKPFELAAITIDLGFTKENTFEGVQKFCDELGVPYHVVPTDIADIVFNERKEKSPCSLCSKMRRGALNTKLNEIGFNKLALGHNADDVIETFLLSLVYEGRLSTFQPMSFMDRTNVTMIRPMVLIWENEIISYAKSENLPIVHSPCPVDKLTKRRYMKELVANIQTDAPFVKERMLAAIVNPDRNNLWDK